MKKILMTLGVLTLLSTPLKATLELDDYTLTRADFLKLFDEEDKTIQVDDKKYTIVFSVARSEVAKLDENGEFGFESVGTSEIYDLRLFEGDDYIDRGSGGVKGLKIAEIKPLEAS